jgi:hypothetical protein
MPIERRKQRADTDAAMQDEGKLSVIKRHAVDLPMALGARQE